MLDDGVEGLKEIKRNGGLAIVQAPAEAGYPDMPQNALAKIEIDHCAPVAQIRELMTRLNSAVLWRSSFSADACDASPMPLRLNSGQRGTACRRTEPACPVPVRSPAGD